MFLRLVRCAQQSLDDLLMFARLTRDLRAFVRNPIKLDTAQSQMRCNLARREGRLIVVLERLIYGHPASPYLTLLRNAGCELGDVRDLIRQDGVEGALNVLASRGVYVSFDEMKGRREAVRGSQRFSFRDRDFDNPAVPSHFALQTGGTRGLPSLVGRSLPYFAEKSASRTVALDAHGLRNPLQVFWLTGPVGQILLAARLGISTKAWFHPIESLPLKVRAGARYLQVLGRLAGYPIPSPVHLDLEQADRLVERLVTWTRSGRQVIVSSPTSLAVRTAVAALAAGIRLDRVTFHTQSELMSPARRRHIEAAGAHAMPAYGSTETSAVGYACATPTAADDVHVFEDGFAVVTRPRAVQPGGPLVDALHVTTLSPIADTICFNSETGDCATLERRPCGCTMGELGLRTHLSEIRSFEKLTGEGMTVVRSNLLHVLEEVLPRRFGGCSLDYQLIEQEGADSTTRVILRVHPAIGPIDEDAVRATLLAEIARVGSMDTFMTQVWQRAGTVTICRRAPLPTAAGKILPFHLAKTPAGP